MVDAFDFMDILANVTVFIKYKLDEHDMNPKSWSRVASNRKNEKKYGKAFVQSKRPINSLEDDGDERNEESFPYSCMKR